MYNLKKSPTRDDERPSIVQKKEICLKVNKNEDEEIAKHAPLS